MKVKKIAMLVLISSIIAIILSFVVIDNNLHYVESSIVYEDKIYGVEKNGEWFKLFQCDLDGTDAVSVLIQKVVSDSHFYEYESLVVQGSVAKLELTKISLIDSDDRKTLYYYYDFSNNETWVGDAEYTREDELYHVEINYLDSMLYVDYSGNIYSSCDDEEAIVFENNGDDIPVENIGYVYYEDTFIVYNTTREAYYSIHVVTGEVTLAEEKFPELFPEGELNLEEYGEISYFTIGDAILCGMITDEGELLPLVIQDNMKIVKNLVDSRDVAMEEFVVFFIVSFVLLVILWLFYSKFPTIGKIFVFSMIAILITYIYASSQINELQVDELVSSEIQKLSLQVNCITVESEDDYEELIEQVEMQLSSSRVFTTEGEEFIKTTSIVSRYNEIIQVTEAGYNTWDSEELYYAPTENLYLQEEIEALDIAVGEGVIVSSFSPYIYNMNSITIYIPITGKDGEVNEVLRSTYFYEDVESSTYVTDTIKPFMNFLFLVTCVILVICGIVFAIVTRVNRSLRQNGKYIAKRCGISEIGKLKEIITDMSKGIQWKLEKSSEMNDVYETYIPREVVELFGKKDISEIQLGDESIVTRTILMINSNDFVEVEKNMDNQQAFEIVDGVFRIISSSVQKHNGFVSSFNDMNAMTMFKEEPKGVEDAVISGSEIFKTIIDEKKKQSRDLIQYGGVVIRAQINVGVVGSQNRMEILMVSEDLERAKSIADISYKYQTGVLIEWKAAQSLADLEKRETIRFFGVMDLDMNQQDNYLYEEFSGQNEEQIRLKKLTKVEFEHGVKLMIEEQYKDARNAFVQVLKKNSHDNIAYHYFSICNDKINEENEVD